MNRNKIKLREVSLFALLCALALLTGCYCGEDNSSNGSSHDDDSPTPDDDDTGSDDDLDDDSTPDDDNDTDDDQDDDQDDDITPDDDDNDTDDDDTIPDFPPDPGVWMGEVFIQQIAGGNPGDKGTSMAIGPDGTKYIASVSGRILFLYSLAPGKAEWERELVDHFAMWADIDIDVDGYVHTVYADTWNEKSKYATNKSGSWNIEVIGEFCAAAVAADQTGAAHIAFCDPVNYDLLYTTNASGEWVTEVAESSGDVGAAPDIALDSNGKVHIIHNNVSEYFSNYILYTTNKSGSWSTVFTENNALV